MSGPPLLSTHPTVVQFPALTSVFIANLCMINSHAKHMQHTVHAVSRHVSNWRALFHLLGYIVHNAQGDHWRHAGVLASEDLDELLEPAEDVDVDEEVETSEGTSSSKCKGRRASSSSSASISDSVVSVVAPQQSPAELQALEAEAASKGYGKMYAAFGGGREGLEACAASELPCSLPHCMHACPACG